MSSLLSIEDPPQAVKPTATVVVVTPDIAERWLGRNQKNRPVKDLKVATFARDMSAGRWQITGEAIKFAADGTLLDGQNRLLAIIRSGVPQPLFVVRGLEPTAQEVMDSGAPRSAADALHLRGFSCTKDLSAAVIGYHAWSAGFYSSAMHQSTPRLTNSEVLEVAHQHPGLADSTRVAISLRRHLPLPMGSLATAHYVLSDLDYPDTQEFFSRIVDLRTSGKGDPIHALLKRVSESRERRERIWVATGLFYLFRAWNACRVPESLDKFQLGSPLRGWVKIPQPR